MSNVTVDTYTFPSAIIFKGGGIFSMVLICMVKFVFLKFALIQDKSILCLEQGGV